MAHLSHISSFALVAGKTNSVFAQRCTIQESSGLISVFASAISYRVPDTDLSGSKSLVRRKVLLSAAR